MKIETHIFSEAIAAKELKFLVVYKVGLFRYSQPVYGECTGLVKGQ